MVAPWTDSNLAKSSRVLGGNGRNKQSQRHVRTDAKDHTSGREKLQQESGMVDVNVSQDLTQQIKQIGNGLMRWASATAVSLCYDRPLSQK